MDGIRNIYCVGRNYLLHTLELKNDLPKAPMMFSKPTHALAKARGQEIWLPASLGAVHYETEMVLHVARPYEKGMLIHELANRMTVGLDFTLRDIQEDLKKKGHPWLLAKGFKHSAVLGRWIPFPGEENCTRQDFKLLKNGETVQTGNTRDLMFSMQTLVDYVGEHFGLSTGDIFYTGTPKGVGLIQDRDTLSLFYGEEELGTCMIRLEM